MPEDETEQTEQTEQPEHAEDADTTAAADEGAPAADTGLVDAVDSRAAELTGAQGAAETEAPVADNRHAVAAAEDHLDDANLASDRETLKKLQQDL